MQQKVTDPVDGSDQHVVGSFRACPPISKQYADIQMLLDEFEADRQGLCKSGDKDSASSATVGPGAVAYLIAASWWKGWQEYVSFPIAADDVDSGGKKGSGSGSGSATSSSSGSKVRSSGGASDGRPLPIDNSCLLLAPSMTTVDNEGASNEHIFVELKPGLVETKDFVCVPEAAWDALQSWFGGGPAIPRLVVVVNGEVGGGADGGASVGRQSILDLWPAEPVTRANALALLLQRWRQGRSSSLSGNSGGGGDGSDGGEQFSAYESQARAKSLSLAEISAGASDCGSSAVEDPTGAVVELRRICFVCKDPSKLRCKGCSAVNYCSRRCQTSHWKCHKKWCSVAAERKDLPTTRFQQVVPVGRRGRVGLHNLGNSCYLNSSLQCLSHIFPLTSYFLSVRFYAHINADSFFGTNGKLAHGYYALLTDLWFQNHAAVSPVSFKKIMGRLNPEYAGLSQQDAHEVIEQFLDKLHEDVNKVSKKPYTEKPEGDGRNDEEVAALAWERHRLREDSEVNDIVGFLLRSQLECLQCGKKTVYFDYYQTLQLAIPRAPASSSSLEADQRRDVPVLFVPGADLRIDCSSLDGGPGSTQSAMQGSQRPVLLSVNVASSDTVGTLKEHAAALIAALVLVGDTRATMEAADALNRLVLLQMGQKLSTLLSVADDRAPVSSLPDDATLAAYLSSADPSHDAQLVLLHRIIEKKEESDVSGGWADEGEDERGLPRVRLAHVPRMIPFSSRWSCARIRILLLQHVTQLLCPERARRLREALQDTATQQVHQLEVLEAVIRAGKAAPVKDLMAVSGRLPVRSVKLDGGPAHIAPAAGAAHPGSDDDALLSSCGGLSDEVHRLLGSSLPPDSQLSFVQWTRCDGSDGGRAHVPIVSADFSGAWLDCLDPAALCDVARHPSVAAAAEAAAAASKTASTKNSSSMFSSMFARQRGGAVTLDQCLAEHMREETLGGENARYCSTCKEHQSAKKTGDFWNDRLPEVLILSLKRFDFQDVSSRGRAAHRREKIETFVDFPIDGLDLAPHCAQRPHRDGEGDGDNQQRTLYDLFAVCNHFGRMGFGHYTACARDWMDMYTDRASSSSGAWFKYDDEDVTAVRDEREILSPAAYILFYRRRPANQY